VEQVRGTESVADGVASSKQASVSFLLLCDLSIRRTQIDMHIAHGVTTFVHVPRPYSNHTGFFLVVIVICSQLMQVRWP
jgi:hypothetical protein